MVPLGFYFLSIILTDVAASTVENNSSKVIVKRQIQNSCDEGWFSFGDKCYGTGGPKKMKLTWEKAIERCEELGGTLASIHSKEQTDFLAVFISMNIQEAAWIGLHDRENESIYTWVDFTKFDFENWEPGEPSGFKLKEEDCVHFVYYSGAVNGAPGQWADLKCDKERAFICQKRKSKQSRKNADPRFCPDGGWKLKASCYHVVEKKLTWAEAEDYCIEKHGGHLATINDFSANLFLKYVLRTNTDNMWIGMKIKNGFQQQWSSGWYVAFTNWMTEPGDFLDGTCAVRTLDKWIMLPCNRRLPSICEISTETVPNLTSSNESYCPVELVGWRDLGGEFCYYVNNDRLSWFQANFKCLRRGGTLASFYSQTELDALQPFLIPTWLDLRYFLWIGLLRQQYDEVFAWVDGTAMNFTSWDDNEPSSKQEQCVEINPNTMKWNDFSCDEPRPYVCSVRKINLKGSITTSSEAQQKASCSNGFSADVFISVICCSLFVNFLSGIVICYLCARCRKQGRPGKIPHHLRLNFSTLKQIPSNNVAIEDDDYDVYEIVR